VSESRDRRDQTYAELIAQRILAIVRYRSGGDVVAAVDAIASGGITAIEVTTNTPGWESVVSAVSAQGAKSQPLIGVGTVTTPQQVDQAASAGARFIVSPGFDPSVTSAAFERGLEALPGVTTATEILSAQAHGVRLLKLFPAGALGIPYLQQLRGPFPDVAFVATGGIALDAVDSWHKAGARLVSLGSALTGVDVPTTSADWDEFHERISEATS
jgi:Entner-Doudoroff aldolase